LTLLVSWSRRTRLFSRVPFHVLNLAIPLFLVVGAVAADPVGTDVGMLCLGLLVALLIALRVKRIPFFALERLSAYTTAIVVVYLMDTSTDIAATCRWCLPVFYVSLAAAAAVWVRFSSAGFQVSTLDLLILLAAITAPTLQGLGLQHIGTLALETIVLFYGIEILIRERERHWDALRLGVLTAMTIVAVKGLL
jgi:UDP-GlcNAc:undecaprenyl-phosphate GlcNAc-1-phosphate transferase